MNNPTDFPMKEDKPLGGMTTLDSLMAPGGPCASPSCATPDGPDSDAPC